MLKRKVIFPHLALPLGMLTLASCGSPKPANRIEPVYSKENGRLQLLKYDADGNGKIDTWSYMDAARILRIDVDRDEDGKIDRWEYYGPDQKIEKIGFSRLSDGKEDAWSFGGPDGTIVRIDVSTRRDGKITRVEHYEKDALVRAEEDTGEDGRMDKWETFEDGRLTSVAFDTVHRGTPDRRIVYGPNGAARVEIDPAGTGRFVPARDARTPRAAR